MATISWILVVLIALEHVYILYLEMFLWTTPTGLKSFDITKEFADASKSLAANQGLYNGFLAAGLLWGAVHPDANVAHQLQLFFLACVLVAGVYGGLSVKRSILWIQGAPALIGLVVVLLS